MPVHSHHTQFAAASQLSEVLGDAWSTDIVPRLPAHFDQQAHRLKAFQRKRGLLSASDLLRGILAYVLDATSFRLLGAWAVLIGLADISDTAWRKRLRRANAWLAWLLSELLAASVATAPDLLLRQRRVLLIDTTRLRQVGGSGDDWRAHLSYSLREGRMSQVVVTDRKGAEQLAHFELQPTDIVVGDCGYGYRKNVAKAREAQADVVLRVCLSTFPLLDDHGQPFDALAWVLRQHAVAAEWKGWCSYKGRQYRVRLIASKLPAEKVAAIRKRKRRKARSDKRKISSQTLQLASWLLLITTLDTSWTATEVLRLYRARWQIELVFKRIKQLLRLADLRCRERAALEATVRAVLIAWALQEQVASEVRALLPSGKREPNEVPSSWLLASLSVMTLRSMVRGSFRLSRMKECQAQLKRFVVSSPRKRRQQEADIRHWLQQRLEQAPALLEAA
jgi:hypothetical protein